MPKTYKITLNPTWIQNIIITLCIFTIMLQAYLELYNKPNFSLTITIFSTTTLLTTFITTLQLEPKQAIEN